MHFFVLFLVAVCTLVNPFNWHKQMITEDWINLCIQHHVHKTGLYLNRSQPYWGSWTITKPSQQFRKACRRFSFAKHVHKIQGTRGKKHMLNKLSSVRETTALNGYASMTVLYKNPSELKAFVLPKKLYCPQKQSDLKGWRRFAHT